MQLLKLEYPCLPLDYWIAVWTHGFLMIEKRKIEKGKGRGIGMLQTNTGRSE